MSDTTAELGKTLSFARAECMQYDDSRLNGWSVSGFIKEESN